jgi:lipoyl(octanoyl) transferase
MSSFAANRVSPEPAVEFHLLGQVDFDDCLWLQRRLVYEAGEGGDGRIAVLICEHPQIITVGRRGSRGHIRLTNEQLRRRQLHISWVSRGGGCVLHAPGQLAIYPIVPLAWHGWNVGQYMQRFQTAVVAALQDLNIRGETREETYGIWGRSGQLVAFGVSIKNWISCHGAFINVNPAMSTYGFIDATPLDSAPLGGKTTMGCLLADRRHGVTLTKVRAALVANLASSFGCERYHLHTGHPILLKKQQASREHVIRAS